jgi:hypothetical protein
VVGGGAVVVGGGGAVVVVGGGGGAVVVVAGTVVVVAGGRVVGVMWGRVVVVDELLVVVVVGLLEPELAVMSTMINTIKMTARATINHGHQLRFFSPSPSWPPGGRCPGGWYAPAAVGTTVVASPGPVTALVGWSAADVPWTLVGWSAGEGPWTLAGDTAWVWP